jgi:hypothetical protein
MSKKTLYLNMSNRIMKQPRSTGIYFVFALYAKGMNNGLAWFQLN